MRNCSQPVISMSNWNRSAGASSSSAGGERAGEGVPVDREGGERDRERRRQHAHVLVEPCLHLGDVIADFGAPHLLVSHLICIRNLGPDGG